MFLNKKLKNLEDKRAININNSMENNKSESASFINSNPNVSDLIKNSSKKLYIKNIKRHHNFHSSASNNIIYKKLMNKNISLSTINYNQLEYNSNINKKSTNKNNSMNESMSFYISKIDDNINNNNSRNNQNKNFKNIKSIKLDKSKVPVNITNNNYNVQKNNVLITLNSINLEKMKIQKKLAEYKKLIDKKINNLRKNNINKLKVNKSRKKSLFMRKGLKFEKVDSFRNSEYDVKSLEKSVFIKTRDLDKNNTSYRSLKRDSSYNIERKKKK